MSRVIPGGTIHLLLRCLLLEKENIYIYRVHSDFAAYGFTTCRGILSATDSLQPIRLSDLIPLEHLGDLSDLTLSKKEPENVHQEPRRGLLGIKMAPMSFLLGYPLGLLACPLGSRQVSFWFL